MTHKKRQRANPLALFEMSGTGRTRFGVRLDQFDLVDGRLALARVNGGREFHLLAFSQRAHAAALERAGVHEHIGAAVFRCDETKTFLVVKNLTVPWVIE